jgi:peptidyl-prolyl cis-trans isomerase B (cyclophilin B)
MARAPSSYNSATSQFFIVHEDSTFLDGEYAAFGWVTDGMEVVDAICEDTPIQDYNGTVLPKDQPVLTQLK